MNSDHLRPAVGASAAPGPASAFACARELLIAVPRTLRDIYLLHQEVWRQIEDSRDVRLRSPEILYRRDGGCVSIRVGAAALRHGSPSSFSARLGEVRPFALRCALWRDEAQLRHQCPDRRVRELLATAGMELLDHELTLGVASGHKSRIDAAINLPTADLRGRLRIIDHRRAAQAWRLGIGRGRRFGFGMLVLQD